MRVLTASNAKLQKGRNAGYYSVGLHLAPHTLSGYNVCPMASKGCAAACLNTAGNGNYPATQKSRIVKTRRFFESRTDFMDDVILDIRAAEKKAIKLGLKLSVRLNLTSDIRFENIPVRGYDNIMAMFPHVAFMDYTKLLNRRNLPANYHLTVSRSENNEADALATGHNVAVVFRVDSHGKGALPESWKGRKVVDGDVNDLRFLDGDNVVVGLRAKGKGQTDQSGFVVRL